ncbi:MAG: DMT family transporter [Alphaproteobacteria bacterium]|nr:DMT family transporter [Alphaproteobacteria bacterium]
MTFFYPCVVQPGVGPDWKGCSTPVPEFTLSAALLPIVFSLVAAFLFALGAQFQSLGLAYMDSRSGAAITIGTSAMLFILAAPVFLEIDNLLHPAVLIFMLIGCFRPAVSANLALAGMRHLGPTLSSTLTSTAPFFGAALGVFWLGEVLTWPTAVGTLAIVFAIMMLSTNRDGVASSWPLWALALPVGAAAIRSGAHVLTKVGMESVPDVYIAGLVGFVVSAIITLCIHKARRDAPPIPWISPGARWFMGASCCFSLAVIALNTALHVGQVVQVIPIVAASPIFTLLLSVTVFRREKITIRVVGAVFIVVPAVILIAVAG